MHSSIVVLIALAAAASAAPVNVDSRATGGFSKGLGNVANGAGLLSSGINIGNFLGGFFGGDDSARRELEARAGLASVGKVGNNLLNAGSLAFSLGNIGDAISGLFSREDLEMFARDLEIESRSLSDIITDFLEKNFGDKIARRAATGGFSKTLGNVASGAGLLSSGINIGNFLGGLFGGEDAARRELSTMVARELDARAGLASVGKVGNNLLNAGSLAFSLGNIGDAISGLFSREEIETMVARDIDARAGLASVGKVGNNLLNAGSLAFSLGNIGDAISGLFSREVTDEYVREVIEQEIYRRAVADLD